MTHPQMKNGVSIKFTLQGNAVLASSGGMHWISIGFYGQFIGNFQFNQQF